MEIDFHKYHGTGNDFIMIDNRNLSFPAEEDLIKYLCDRRFGIGADGLILLQNHPNHDFEMRYFNSDGREASMCGNGGRCVVAFAEQLGIIKEHTDFLAFDGIHKASFKNNVIELSMSDVTDVKKKDDIFLLDTGSPQAVLFVNRLETIDVFKLGCEIRYRTDISQNGVNVNFVEIKSESEIKIRTYERGVETETWSCGTGSVASAIVSSLQFKNSEAEHSVEVHVKGGKLRISFESTNGKLFTNIILAGPATGVFSGKIKI